MPTGVELEDGTQRFVDGNDEKRSSARTVAENATVKEMAARVCASRDWVALQF